MVMDLAEAIKSVSQKKDVLTDNARRAQKEYSQVKNDIPNIFLDAVDEITADLKSKSEKEDLQLELADFKLSVKLLDNIIRAARIDEMVYFLANPGKLYITQFYLGLVKGTGFALGFLFVVFLASYVLLNVMAPELITHLLSGIIQ